MPIYKIPITGGGVEYTVVYEPYAKQSDIVKLYCLTI